MDSKASRKLEVVLPLPQERKFYNEVVATNRYTRAQKDLLDFCCKQNWSALSDKFADGFRQTIQDTLRSHARSIIYIAWSIVSAHLEEGKEAMEKRETVTKRMRDCQRAYLQEVTRLKDDIRANQDSTKDMQVYVPDFNEDIELFDATQFYDDEDKEVIKLIVDAKVKTAVSQVMRGKSDAEIVLEGIVEARDRELSELRGEIDGLHRSYQACGQEKMEIQGELEARDAEIGRLRERIDKLLMKMRVKKESMKTARN